MSQITGLESALNPAPVNGRLTAMFQAVSKPSIRLAEDVSRVSADCVRIRESSRSQTRSGANGAAMIPSTNAAVANRKRHGDRQIKTRRTTARPRYEPREKVKMTEMMDSQNVIWRPRLSHGLVSTREK